MSHHTIQVATLVVIARSDRSEWNEGDVADDAAEAFRWGYGVTEDASGEGRGEQ